MGTAHNLRSFDSVPGNLAAETIVWSDHQLRACHSTDITSSHQALALYEESIGVKEINHLSYLWFSRTALIPPESTLPLAASEKSNAAPIWKVAALITYSLPHTTEESENQNQLSEVKIKASRTQINPVCDCVRLILPNFRLEPYREAPVRVEHQYPTYVHQVTSRELRWWAACHLMIVGQRRQGSQIQRVSGCFHLQKP